MFLVDYMNDVGEVVQQSFPTPASAEAQARQLSKLNPELLIYVFRQFGATGQRVYCSGVIYETDREYITDRRDAVAA